MSHPLPSEIFHYFPNLSSSQREQFTSLYPLYEDWNSKINVISRKDIDQLYVRHVLHSLAIYRFIQFQPGSKILDIGTGGGFPGIPLAIMMPDVQFLLTDSIGKKITVVQEVSQALGLQNVKAQHIRSEQVRDKFDFVISRAVAEMKELLAWSQNKIISKQINAIPNGLVCLKGGDLKDEFSGLRKDIETYPLSSWFKEEFFETKKLIYVPLV
ncbi:MAG: 16S rRNA (guanine(527)-N(7))-methyltransferase RsmG [Flavobacteriales bacterium]|nr:16S rRNA (guanine(527)-N(7))-methyltransferase RsmG [Flavobacteriales bacterium]